MEKRIWGLCLLSGILTAGPAGFALAVEPGFEQYRRSVLEDIERHKETVRKNPSEAEAHFKLGLAYMSLGRHIEEIAAYEEAVRIKPDYADAHSNMGLAYDSLMDGDRAIAHTLKARELYMKQKNPGGIRKTSRRLTLFYDKYRLNPEDFEAPE